SDRTASERAGDALLSAADRARRRMESRSAVDFYERALALAGPTEQWGLREARGLAGLGEARYWLGEYAPATDALNRAVSPGEARRGPDAPAPAPGLLGGLA